MTRPGQRSHKINHPVITRVDADIFTATFAPDCMEHQCRCRDENDLQRNDACCQHGADVQVAEKAAILKRAAEIASIMKAERQGVETWFDERDPEEDPSVPGGIIVRTATAEPDNDTSGCIFLEHTGARGCGLHRAALVHGFDPDEIKPSVCRIYPLSHDAGRLGLAPDFNRYSCANHAGPRLYRLMREVLRILFGAELIVELDRVESLVMKRTLTVLPNTNVSPEP